MEIDDVSLSLVDEHRWSPCFHKTRAETKYDQSTLSQVTFSFHKPPNVCVLVEKARCELGAIWCVCTEQRFFWTSNAYWTFKRTSGATLWSSEMHYWYCYLSERVVCGPKGAMYNLKITRRTVTSITKSLLSFGSTWILWDEDAQEVGSVDSRNIPKRKVLIVELNLVV